MSIKLVDISNLLPKQDAADLSAEEVVAKYEDTVNKPLFNLFVKKEDVVKSYKELNTEPSPTYYKSLDDKVQFPSSGVVVITGRPGHGKSSLMRNIALRKAINNEKVVYITYEYSQYEEVINFVHTYTGVAPSKDEIVSGRNIAFMKIGDMLSSNLFVTHEIKNIEDIQQVLQYEELRGATVFIDYVQKIPSSNFKGEHTGSEAHIRHVCNVLNDISISNNILIITGSQLTSDRNSSPTQDVVKGAKAIEEVASVLLRVWRHKVNEASVLHDMIFKHKDCDFTLDVMKNRRGPSNQRIGMYIHKGLILKDESEKTIGSKYLKESNEK